MGFFPLLSGTRGIRVGGRSRPCLLLVFVFDVLKDDQKSHESKEERHDAKILGGLYRCDHQDAGQEVYADRFNGVLQIWGDAVCGRRVPFRLQSRDSSLECFQLGLHICKLRVLQLKEIALVRENTHTGSKAPRIETGKRADVDSLI